MGYVEIMKGLGTFLLGASYSKVNKPRIAAGVACSLDLVLVKNVQKEVAVLLLGIICYYLCFSN